MVKKKLMYEAYVVALPPLYMMLGDVPATDPDRRRMTAQQNQKLSRLNPDMEGTVKRLIAYFKDEK